MTNLNRRYCAPTDIHIDTITSLFVSSIRMQLGLPSSRELKRGYHGHNKDIGAFFRGDSLSPSLETTDQIVTDENGRESRGGSGVAALMEQGESSREAVFTRERQVCQAGKLVLCRQTRYLHILYELHYRNAPCAAPSSHVKGRKTENTKKTYVCEPPPRILFTTLVCPSRPLCSALYLTSEPSHHLILSTFNLNHTYAHSARMTAISRCY